jgi:FeS assembly SUF system protein
MSSPRNDAAVEGRVIPLITNAAGEPALSASDSLRPPLVPDPATTETFRPQIATALSSIFDPEIPVNIYELGLIYDIAIDAEASVEIRMTLTAPGCPAAQTLPVQVEQRVRDIPGVKEVRVEIVWEPPWTKDRMSDAAKLQLGIF